MKKVLLLVALMLVGTSYAGNGRVNVRVSPALLFGCFNTQVDYQLKKSLSVGGRFTYSAFWYKHYSIGIAVNHIFKDRNIMKDDGLMFSGYVTYDHGKFSKGFNVAEQSNNTIAGVLAYQSV